MTVQDLGAIGEFLGLFVILITLLFLAKQTKQNAVINHAKEQRVLIDQFNTYVRQMTEPETLPAFRKALANFTEMDMNSQAIAWRTFAQWVNFIEQCHNASAGGLLPKDALAALERWVVGMLVTPGGAEYWRVHGGSHGTNIQGKINARLADKVHLPPPITEDYAWLRGSDDG